MTIPFSRPLQYLIVAAGTQLLLGIAAVVVLLPTGLLTSLPWPMLAALLTYNVLIATLIAIIVNRHTLTGSSADVRSVGLVLGHFVGLVLGASLGWKYGGTPWAIAGASALYFAVGWVGSQVSLRASDEFAHLTTPRRETNAEKLIRASRRPQRTWYIFGASIPAMVLLIVLFLKTTGWAVGEFANMLPAARTVSVGLSLLSILIPWTLRSRSKKQRKDPLAKRSASAVGGIAFSLAPAIYGLMAYVGFGLSVSELLLFALSASIATTAWGAKTTMR